MSMYINAYATVRDEIPGPYSHQRGADDPELAEHLQGFTGFVWERGGQEMTAAMWGLIRHIGETRRQYVFERDSIEGLEDWAREANAVLLLPEGQGRTLLWLVWAGAIAGVLFRVLWVGAPRWLYTPVYVALGWVAVFYLPGFWRNGGVVVVALIAAGGLLYTLGAVVYGTKRPNPSPRWFGFHEIFHAFTIVAFAAHYVAVSFSVYGAIPAASG